MNIAITHKISGDVLYTAEEVADFRSAVERAVKAGINLNGANLGNANLRDACLRGANLRYAYLSDADLRGADLGGANLREAYLGDAYLCGAYLSDADLCGAYLSDADLRGAYLGDAYLRDACLGGANLRDACLGGADLRGAYLGDAYLRGVYGINKNLVTPLRIILEQTGAVRAYKLIGSNGEGLFNGGIKYDDPDVDIFSVDAFNPDENNQCGAGINLATLDWVMKEWKPGCRILIMEFFVNEPEGNLCVPTATDGKFRVKQCRRVGEKNLVELGLVEDEQKAS